MTKRASNDEPDDLNSIDFPEEISKSQRKREADAITQLGQTISELGQSDLNKLPLDDKVREAVDTLRSIGSFGARKRQLHYLGKILRSTDLAPITSSLEAIRQSAQSDVRHFQKIEQWRDRMLTGNDEILAEFLRDYPNADRQRLRQLIRNNTRELRHNKPPKSARELFKLLREILAEPN